LKMDDLSAFSVFGSNQEDLPELEVFEEGLGLFRVEFQCLMGTWISVQNLIRFGGRLRRIKMEAMLEDQEEISEELEDSIEDDEEWSWYPEAVCQRMKGMIRYSHKLLARSNWYARLANSTVYWDQRQGKNRIGITLEDAVIVKNYRISEPKKSNPSISKKQRIQKVKHQFDILDYDRMRVFTTE